MKNIGILLDSPYQEKYIIDFINELKNNKNIKLFLIPSEKEKHIYDYYISLEEKLLSNIFNEIKTYTKKSYLQLSYDKNLKLDLLINLNFCKPPKITAKDGTISLNYNKPISFWEVLLRKDNLNFSINYENNNNKITLLNGKLSTLRFISQMKIRVFRESLVFIEDFIKQYANNNTLLANTDNTHNFDTKIPSIVDILKYIFKTIRLFFILAFKRKILKQHPRFHVGFMFEDFDNNLYNITQIKTPPFHFYADPFVYTYDNRHIVFLEDFDYKKNIACISCVEIFQDKSYKILGKVIDEPFHLSFPYLFEYQNTLFMIPESSASMSIRVYKCLEFPLKWQFEKEIMKDIKAADTIVFEKDSKWWLLTNHTTKNNDDQASLLYIYQSDSPLSQNWIPHKKNPVIFDSNTGRNAGIIIKDNQIIRARQKQKFNLYGAEFSLAKIEDLTLNSYKENELLEIKPNFLPNIKATHHLNSKNGITVVDFMKYEKIY